MHILLGLIGMIGAVGGYLFWARRAGEATVEAVDLAQRLRGKMRREAFRKRAVGSPLTAVEDPGTAAAIFLFKMAELRGEVSKDAGDLIREMLREEIGLSDWAETADFAEWAARQVVNPVEVVRRFHRLWIGALTPGQLTDFRRMARRVSEADGERNREQRELMLALDNRLPLPPN